jgi:putative FmdB family regulatory protein
MPIYEYKCEKCRKKFEKIQKVADPQCKKCPDCGGPLHKLVSSPAIQFKGSGFYITDYPKKNDSTTETKSQPKEKVKVEKSAEATPESKPAAD